MTDDVIEPSSSEESSQDTGLLDNVNVEPAAQEADPNKTAISHLDTPEDDGPLERPDWWPENFWKKDDSEPDLEAIAKSWTDLRKQISQGKHKAPADGNYDLAAFGSVPDTDPVKSHVVTWAKEYGVSQVALDALVSKVVEMNANVAQTTTVNLEQERKSLGPNADARIKSVVQWGTSLVHKGVWGKDDFEEFKVMGGTAKGIAALEKIRAAYEGRVPTDSAPVGNAPSKTELYAMVGDPKYQTDQGYREKVEKMFQASFGT
jgi:hypothetical protein